jgi:hypothetical protein
MEEGQVTSLPPPTEHEEAVLLTEYLTLFQNKGEVELFSHIPNETFTKNWGTKTKNKQEGVRKGVPDYIIVTKEKVIFIELKRIKGSSTSPEQIEWNVKLQGKTTDAYIARGFEEARKYLEKYLQKGV